MVSILATRLFPQVPFPNPYRVRSNPSERSATLGEWEAFCQIFARPK